MYAQAIPWNPMGIPGIPEFKKRNWEWNGFDFYGLLRQ
jgi:hypothetical protein